MSINRTIIQGRLTKDIELRHTQTGTPVTSFTVAWSEKRGDSEQVLFLPCVAWRSTAEFVSKYFAKGQEIAVEGKLSSRKWQDKNGNDRETVELSVDQVHFCGAKKERDSFDDLADRVNSFKEVNNDDGFLPF